MLRKQHATELENQRLQLQEATSTIEKRESDLTTMKKSLATKESELRSLRLKALQQPSTPISTQTVSVTARASGAQATPKTLTSAAQATPSLRFGVSQTGPSLANAPIYHIAGGKPTHASPPTEHLDANANDDMEVIFLRRQLLEAEKAELRERLASLKRRKDDDESTSSVKNMATDEDEEDSCATAIVDSARAEKVLQEEDKFGEPYAALTLDRSELGRYWEKYLRIPNDRTSIGMQDIVAEIILSIQRHYDVCKLAISEQVSARMRYACIKMMRMALMTGHRYRLTIARCNRQGYDAFNEQCRVTRTKNRKGSTTFETMAHAVTKILTTTKYFNEKPDKKYERGGHYDQKDPAPGRAPSVGRKPGGGKR